MTCFSFYMRASMRVHKRFMTSNQSFKTIVYAIDVCMAIGRCVHGSWQTHACLSGTHTPKLDYAHANCKPRTAE